MIWLTWRQFRTQAFVAGIALAALSVALLATEPQLRQLYDDSGLASCHTACDKQIEIFRNLAGGTAVDHIFNLTLAAIFVLPAIAGIFWGAPLVARELESGTHRLVWNQSVTRTRWLLVKLLVGGLTTVAVTELFTVAFWWWAHPIDRTGISPLSQTVFGARGIVPMGYAAFAFVLGVAVGVFARRTLVAMAVTLVVVAFCQIAMPTWVRAHLLPAQHMTVTLDTANIRGIGMSDNGSRMFLEADVKLPGSWIVDNSVVKPDGTPFTGPADLTKCGPDASPKSCFDWIASMHLRQAITYQPANRFWPLQFIETGIFVALALGLAGLCFWWVRRRLS